MASSQRKQIVLGVVTLIVLGAAAAVAYNNFFKEDAEDRAVRLISHGRDIQRAIASTIIHEQRFNRIQMQAGTSKGPRGALVLSVSGAVNSQTDADELRAIVEKARDDAEVDFTGLRIEPAGASPPAPPADAPADAAGGGQ